MTFNRIPKALYVDSSNGRNNDAYFNGSYGFGDTILR